ncbi:Retrovirus-related Pol polyprotein from transposon RE2 [Linum perenne]
MVKPRICSGDDWIVDSGAIDHIACSIEFLDNYQVVSNSHVSLPNGESVPITHIGPVMINNRLRLTDVLVIPSFKFNLLPISKLVAHHSCVAVFSANTCVFQDTRNSQMIGTARERNGLYYFRFPRVDLAFSCSTVFFDLWHFRLGHSSVKSLVNSLGSQCSDRFHCKICPIAKQQRLPFSSSSSLADEAFSLIHVDIWGPFSEPTLNGERYFLTLVDDNTRFTWVRLMKLKSEARQLLIDFSLMVEKISLALVFRLFVPTMVLNLLCMISISLKASSTKLPVFTHLSRTVE